MRGATHIVTRRILEGRRLDTVSDEAEDGSDPEKERETAEQLLAELHPLGRGFGRSQFVGTIALQEALRLL